MAPTPPREFARPVELAGMRSRLDRAKRVEARIADTGRRYDKVLDAIEEKEAQCSAHAGQLERLDGDLAKMIESMIGGSNQPPEKTGGNGVDSDGPNSTVKPGDS